MPFRIDHFQENVERSIKGAARKRLLSACDAYRKLSTPRQKTMAIQAMMELLDGKVTADTRKELMQTCGRRCICTSILNKVIRLQNRAADLDDLLNLLNEAHIGGGHLRRKGDIIHAEYHRCYCGSVSKTKARFSPTYCQCSCGWYRQLFETILRRPVTVELLGSIIQGDSHCRFEIHLR